MRKPPVWLFVLAFDTQGHTSGAMRTNLTALLSSNTTGEAAFARTLVYFGGFVHFVVFVVLSKLVCPFAGTSRLLPELSGRHLTKAEKKDL